MLRLLRTNTRRNPPALMDEGGLVRLESLEGAPLGDMTLGALLNVIKHHAARGYGIRVDAPSTLPSTYHRLGAALELGLENIAFDLIRGNSVIVGFDNNLRRDLPTPSVEVFRVRLP